MEKELLQIKTNKKQELKEIAKNKGISLNALMIFIIDDFLKNKRRV